MRRLGAAPEGVGVKARGIQAGHGHLRVVQHAGMGVDAQPDGSGAVGGEDLDCVEGCSCDGAEAGVGAMAGVAQVAVEGRLAFVKSGSEPAAA